MAGIITESHVSRPFSIGLKSASRELVWDIINTTDEGEVQTLILGATPAVYQGLILDSVEAEPIGVDEVTGLGIWKGRSRYVSPEIELTFDSGGGTQKKTQSFATMASYPGDAPSYNGAIGVSDDRVEGVDIVIPKFDFTHTQTFPEADVTIAYRNAIFDLTGCFNDASFKGFDMGEVLFMGASGQYRPSNQWTITFKFSASPNQTGLTVGSITGIDKLGWDYLWIRYSDFISGFGIVPQPTAVYVERVYPPGDLGLLLIGV